MTIYSDNYLEKLKKEVKILTKYNSISFTATLAQLKEKELKDLEKEYGSYESLIVSNNSLMMK